MLQVVKNIIFFTCKFLTGYYLVKLKKAEKNIICDAASKVSRVLPSVHLFKELTGGSDQGLSDDQEEAWGPRR